MWNDNICADFFVKLAKTCHFLSSDTYFCNISVCNFSPGSIVQIFLLHFLPHTPYPPSHPTPPYPSTPPPPHTHIHTHPRLNGQFSKLTSPSIDHLMPKHTVFSQLDAHCVYLKFSLIDPAFIRGRRLIGARRLFTG